MKKIIFFLAFIASFANAQNSATFKNKCCNAKAVPPIIEYSDTALVFPKDVAVNICPITLTGDPIIVVTVTPTLPTGLILDPATGCITGTPTVATSNTYFEFTATNSAGSDIDSIKIMVLAPPPAVVGYLNYPGTTHIDEWVTDNQVISTARNPTSAATIGALPGYTIIELGAIGGTAPLTVAGPATSLGEFNGGGTVVLAAANSIYALTTIQNGATLQLGLNEYSTVGNVYSATVQDGGALDVFGANTTWNTRISESLSNSGTVNWKGSNECGKGMMQVNGWTANNGTINIDDAIFRTTQYGISGTGTINVADGGTLANAGQPVANTQTVNLNGCGWCESTGEKIGALSLSGYNVAYAAKTNIQSPSCIYSAPGDLINFTGLLTGSEPLTIGAAGSAARAGAINFQNQANTYSGVMTVDASTLYGQGSANSLQFATINLINTSVLDVQGGQNIKSLTGDAGSKVQMSAYSTLTLKNNGETTFLGTVVATSAPPASLVLNGGSANVLTLTNPSVGNAVYIADGGSKIVLQGGTISGGYGSENGKLQATNGGIISAGATTTATTSIVQLDATSFLEVRAVGSSASKITTQVFRAPSNFKVNLPDAMAAGTYTILDGIYADGSNGFGKIPTLGINNTGKTPTFSWTGGGGAPGKLIMTIPT